MSAPDTRLPDDLLQDYETAVNQRAMTDILLSVFFALVVFAASVATDAFEAFAEFSRAHEEFELDEIFMFLLALGLGACFYAWRRFIDLRRLLRRRIDADKASAAEQAD